MAIADLNEERGPALAEEIGGLFTAADVTDEERVRAQLRRRSKTFGELRFAALRARASGWAERTVKDRPAGLAAFETVVRVNLIGTFNVLRLAASAMAANEPDVAGERGQW